MHPPLTLHRYLMCAEIIEQFRRCHLDHPVGKFFGQCSDLKIKLDRCFREEKAVKRKANLNKLVQKAVKRKANFEASKKLKEMMQAHRKEEAARSQEDVLPAN